MELIDFTQKREQTGTAAKYDRLTEENQARIVGYMAGLLSSYDFQTLYKALSLQDKRAIDGYVNTLTAKQTQRGVLKNG